MTMTTTARRHVRRYVYLWVMFMAVLMISYSQFQFLSSASSTSSAQHPQDEESFKAPLPTTESFVAHTEYGQNSTNLLLHNHHSSLASPNTTDDLLQICFLTSIYGRWSALVDKLQNVSKLEWYHKAHFFVYTNLPKLPSEGWKRVVQPLPHYQRYITQSRYMKFWAWNDTLIQRDCHVVFYMDSIGHIVGSFAAFQKMARQVYESTQGHAQYLHRGGGGAFGELRRIEVFSKDTMEHIQATKDWLFQQEALYANRTNLLNCTLYENRYIVYAVGRPTTFSKTVQECFWPRYSLEVDSWRDQPLWCYCLNLLGITPIPLTHKELWELRPSRMAKAGHKYPNSDSKQVLVKTRNEQEKTQG